MLLNRIVRFRRRIGTKFYKPGPEELTKAAEAVWLLHGQPDTLQTVLLSRTANADYSGYIKKYHTNLDDDIIKLSKMAEKKLGTEKAAEKAKKEKAAKREARRPRNSRGDCTPLTKAVGDSLRNLTFDTIDKMEPLLGETRFMSYRFMEQAQVAYSQSVLGSNDWEKDVLVDWERQVRQQGEFHTGGSHFGPTGQVEYDRDTPEDGLPTAERMQRLGKILREWSETRDKQLEFYRQWNRNRYQGIVAAARKEYESAYNDGVTTAEQWVRRLQQQYGGHYASDFIYLQGQHDKEITQAVDDAFKSIPLGPAAWAKLTETGVQPVVQVAQSDAMLVGGTRSNYRGSTGITLEQHADSDTIAHEYGHHIEHLFGLGPTLAQWTIDRADYKPMQLGFAYGADETAYPDYFITKYVGKVYPGGTYSEVLSMGIQAALTHPNDFMHFDPEHFFLTIGILLGLGKTIDASYPELPQELTKSEQVKRPGSRGGHPWLDDKGHWRYGKRPSKVTLHNQDTLVWKPTMTEQEAEAWSAHSAYQQPVWHVTTQEAADSIRKEGFKIGNQTNFGREFGGGVYLALDDKTRQFYEKLLRDFGKGTPVTLEGRVNVKKILKLDLTKLPASEDYDYDESGRQGVAKQLPGGLQEFKRRCDAYYESWHDKVYKQALEKYPSGTENDFGTQKYYQYQRERQLYIQDLEKQHDMVGWDDQKLVESMVVRQMLKEAGYDALLVTERPGDNPQWSLNMLGGNQLILPDTNTVTVAKSLFGINFRHPNKLTYMLVLSALDYTTIDQADSRQLTRSLGTWLWKHGRELIKADDAVVDDKPKEHRDIPAGARWITVHPNGRDQEGHPVLVVPAHGRPNTWHVVGGADGKLTHMEVHLNSPEVWKQHAIERAKARHEKEIESGVTPDTKATIREAKEQSQRLYVQRVAQRMGWQDYSDKSSDDFLAQAGGNKAHAAMLAHQYLRSHLTKANEAVKNLRNRLAVDREAFAGADLRLANGETDPYRADENDLIPGDISQRLAESQKVGNTEAATYYQNTLDSLNRGDTEAAKSYLTAGNKSAGVRKLTVQDILPPAKVVQPTGQESTGKKAVTQVQASGELAPAALEQRIAAVTALTKSSNPIDQYTGQLELDALQQATAAIDTKDPAKTNAREAAQAYLQAEKFRAIREKMAGDEQKFQAWKGMREKAIDNAAAVRALRTQGTTGTETVDTDVADMQNARDLLAAKVLYDTRIKALKTAQRSLDPKEMHTVVQDQDTLETDADWDKVYNQATREAFEQIQQAKETNMAIELDTAADNPTNFLRAVGDGEPVDQQHIQRYIQFGQHSALDLIGEVTGGKPTLATTAYQVLGAKTSAKLMANYYASTMKPEEFKAVQDGVADYHTAREFDVANGALVAANAIVDTAQEYKRESDADVDNLYEAAKYNKLRMEAVDRALATIGTAYGELNATAEMNYAFMAAKPQQQGELTLDAGTDDVGQLVKIAHALNLDDQDYQIVDKVKAKGKAVSPHGLVLTASGVGKLFHTATPVQRQRRARLMNIRAGGEDDLLPDGTKATNGWLPAYFANWPATLRNVPAAPPTASPKAVQGQTLQGNPADVTKAVSYALGEQPFATVGFKDTLDADDIKTLQAFYASRRGIAAEKPDSEQVPNVSKTAGTDIFGNPILAQAASGKISDDKASVAWRELVHRVGAQQAITTVQNAIKSDFLSGFVPIYNAMTNQKLATAQEKLTPASNFARLTIGPQAEQQLTDLVQKLAWRYPKGQGAAEYEIPGISMSGRFVAQQRVIKSLEESGGLHGKEGGRLGAFLGVGSGKTNSSIGGYTNLLAKGKARQAIFAMPSAVLGQFGPAIAGVIDPNSPVKWSADTSSTAASRAKSLADPNTHIVAMTHESLRDDTVKALGKLWNVSPKEATTRFMGFDRAERAQAVRQAFDTMGWSKRLDYLSIDEGHQALNRKGKENSILANVFDAIADNSKYYMPQTGTPSKNDTSEVWDWLTKLRPDEHPPEKMQDFLGRHQLLSSETARLASSKQADIASGAEHKRNWTNNAAAAALQQELGENFYSSSAPIKVPVTHQNIDVPLTDQPDDEKVKATADDTLPELMQKGLQKSAYDRVGILEQNIKAAAYKKDWPAVAQQIRELTTTATTAKNGKVAVRNVYTLPDGKEVTPGSPEETDITKRLVTATAMMRDAAYNRVLHTMPNGNAKTKALMNMLDDMGKQDAADDNQPRDKFGNLVPASQRVKGKPVIVFTRSLDAVDNLVKTLKAHGYNAVGISGRDNGADKLRKKELFQPSGKTKPQANVLVMSDAMSAGIDLPRAEAVIHYDTGDTSKVMEQRSARAIRLSTKHPVSVYSLVSDTPYEKRRVDRVARKGALGDVLQNPAETLDDSGLAWYINQRRITHARQEHENPPVTNGQEPALPAKGIAQAKETANVA
jgi:hypothetical protein